MLSLVTAGTFATGADPGFKKGGGHNTQFFLRTAASLKSRASPKKADEREGGDSDTFFFRSATSVESRASPKQGGGGIRHISVFFLGFKRGGHMYKKGGGANVEKGFKRGAWARCAPPPKSATGSALWCTTRCRAKGKTAHTVVGCSGHVCGSVQMSSRSDHGAELTSEMEKIVLFCESVGAFSDIELLTACQHDSANAIFKQSPATFLDFLRFSSPFL